MADQLATGQGRVALRKAPRGRKLSAPTASMHIAQKIFDYPFWFPVRPNVLRTEQLSRLNPRIREKGDDIPGKIEGFGLVSG